MKAINMAAVPLASLFANKTLYGVQWSLAKLQLVVWLYGIKVAPLQAVRYVLQAIGQRLLKAWKWIVNNIILIVSLLAWFAVWAWAIYAADQTPRRNLAIVVLVLSGAVTAVLALYQGSKPE